MEGVITSHGGIRDNPLTNRLEFHDGLDIGCPVGTPVAAVRDGKVLDAGRSPTYGVYMKLSFGEGYTALYAHLSQTLCESGESVSQGQTVAYSGNTGNSTGPHLHYGLFQNGQYVNPALYCDYPRDNGAGLALAP